MFRQGFTCPALLIYHQLSPFAYRAITVYGCTFQSIPLELNRLLG